MKWLLSASVLFLLVAPLLAGDSCLPPCAAWWLAQDDVKPITDLENAAEPGKRRALSIVSASFRSIPRSALIISGEFPEANIWRFDLTTFDKQFDMRKLYVEKSANCAYPDPKSLGTRQMTELLGDPEKGITSTGPWGIYGGKWLVPTARVALDGKHIYTSWFDDPSLEDFKAGRVYTSFALDIDKPGPHTIRISFDDFEHGTRWRRRAGRGTRSRRSRTARMICGRIMSARSRSASTSASAPGKSQLRQELRGKHPRLYPLGSPPATKGDLLTLKDVEAHILYVDPDRGKPWEYSIDAESMASDNDMDAGRKARGPRTYDLHVARLNPEAKKEWDRVFFQRFHQFYTFFVFQRNFHPTGYVQNHSSATVGAILAAGLVWDGPEAEKWPALGGDDVPKAYRTLRPRRRSRMDERGP